MYKIKHKLQKKYCAGKFFKLRYESMDKLTQLGYDRELKALQETSHPLVIKYCEEFIYKRDTLCIVTEFANGGNFE